MSNRRQARKRAVDPEIPVNEDPNRYYRIRFEAPSYGTVTVSFKGPIARRITYDRAPGTEGMGNCCMEHWDPKRFAQLMADPEIHAGLRRSR